MLPTICFSYLRILEGTWRGFYCFTLTTILGSLFPRKILFIMIRLDYSLLQCYILGKGYLSPIFSYLSTHTETPKRLSNQIIEFRYGHTTEFFLQSISITQVNFKSGVTAPPTLSFVPSVNVCCYSWCHDRSCPGI